MTHQNIDKFFKVAAILFGQLFVDAFELNYHVIRLYRNELINLSGDSLFTDLVFETREGILLNFEFQDVKLQEKHLKKYAEYKVSLQCQSGKPVVTVVICTYHIKSEIYIYEETETSFLKPIIHHLIDHYDEVKYISLKNKINNNIRLFDKEVEFLVLMPFMVPKKYRIEKIRQICELIEDIKTKKLFDNDQLYLPLILAIKQYISDEKEKETLIKVLTMDMPADEIYEKVMRSGILEQGIEQGLEQGLKQGLKQGKSQKEEDNVKSLSEFGMDSKEISKALKIDLGDVYRILS